MPTTYLFAGGGTGGHLYPALAIWQELRELAPDAEAMFLCSSRPVDRDVLMPEGVAFQALPAQYPALNPRQFWRFVSNWPASVRIARAAMQQARDRGHSVRLVTLGGFVAAPAVQAARVERVPVTLVNIDAVVGKANRWIAGRAEAAFTTVKSAAHPHWTLVPPVVRREARQTRDQAASRVALGLDPARPVLMVTGGSLGARSINNLLILLATGEASCGSLRGWQVLHQTGSADDAARVQAAYARAGIPAVVASLTRQMPLWWSAADLALSRAGAGAVAEAWATGTPTVFAPYPYHKDQHQQFNAQVLVEAGAAVLAVDAINDQGNLGGPLGQTLLALLASVSKRNEMRNAAAKLGPADGARRIADNLARPVP